MMTQTQAHLKRTIFAPYYAHRLAVEAAQYGGALTPAQELSFVDTEWARTVGDGVSHACAPTGEEMVVRLPSESPVVVALREGREVGERTARATPASTPVQRSRSGRRMMVAGIGLMAFLLLSLIALVVAGTKTETETEEESGRSGELLVVSEESEESEDGEESVATIEATEIPDYVRGSRLFGEEEIVPNAPVSLEVDGVFLSVAVAGDGALWLPEQGVEWWSGTDIRRVFAVGTAELEGTVEIGTVITVRLRSGVSQAYVVSEETVVHRLQTEILSERTPSIILIFPNEWSDDRRVVIGQAVQ